MIGHAEPYEHAGSVLLVKTRIPLFQQDNVPDMSIPFHAEDWWDRLSSGSWMHANGNPACMAYAIRSGILGLPLDDEVIYGHTGDHLGHLVHVSEIQGVWA